MGMVGDFVAGLFDGEIRKKNRIAGLSKKMIQKFGQSEDRMGAANTLADIGTEEAMRAVLRRFTVTVDNHTHDQDEKLHVADILVEFGPPAVTPIREYLAREKEVSWALRTLRRLLSAEEWTNMVLGILEGRTSENTDHEKLEQIFREMHGSKDPRVPAMLASFLKDLDDTIRFAAIEALASNDSEEAKVPLLEALTRPDEESQRVKGRIMEVFKDREWEVKGFRKTVEEMLPEGWYLDRSGRIKRLEAGATRPPD